MLQYTQATLQTALQTWNVNSDPAFVTNLSEIIKRGEIRLSKLLDLDSQDSHTTASATAVLVTKPATLINERLILIDVNGLEDGTGVPLLKRSRAWVNYYNASAPVGVPKYYAEDDVTKWALAPAPDSTYTLVIHGNYLITSIMDGASSTVTWFSTQTPDLLFYACSIEACEYLKAWTKKAQNEQDLTVLAAEFIGVARNLQRSDAEDLVGGRRNMNQPSTQQE